VEGPEIRYASSGDVHIAYGVVGDGPIDVVFVSGWVLSNFGVPWQGSAADFYRGMSSFARLIQFDKRGLGLSDRAQGIPDLEMRMDDIRAVMDAAGSERAAIMGFSEGGPMSVLFAATYPERTAALVLYSTPVSWFRTDEYPWADTREEMRAYLESAEGRRGTEEWCDDRLREHSGRRAALARTLVVVLSSSQEHADALWTGSRPGTPRAGPCMSPTRHSVTGQPTWSTCRAHLPTWT
jgi:pimeloyl-ACP methyl ester carboxylesterase